MLQGCIVPNFVEFDPVVLEKKFFCISSMYIRYLLIISPWKRADLHVNKHESTPLKDVWCQVWLKLVQWLWRRRWKCENFTDRQTDRRTDGRRDRWSEKLTWAFSSGELKRNLSILRRRKRRWRHTYHWLWPLPVALGWHYWWPSVRPVVAL